MLKEKPEAVSGIARAVDIAMISCSFVIAAVVCHGATHIEPLGWLRGTFPVGEEVTHQYGLLMLLSVIDWIAVTQWRGSYLSHRSKHAWALISGHFTTQSIWIMSVGFLAFILKLAFVSREFLLTFLLLGMVTLNLRQLCTRAFLQRVRAKGHNIRRVIVLGSFRHVARIFAVYREARGTGISDCRGARRLGPRVEWKPEYQLR